MLCDVVSPCHSLPLQHFGPAGSLWQRCPVRRHGGDRTGTEIWVKAKHSRSPWASAEPAGMGHARVVLTTTKTARVSQKHWLLLFKRPKHKFYCLENYTDDVDMLSDYDLITINLMNSVCSSFSWDIMTFSCNITTFSWHITTLSHKITPPIVQ